MRLQIEKQVALQVGVDPVWAVVRDPAAVAACLPNARDFRPLDAPGRFATTLVEKLGPFAVQVPLSVDVREDEADRRMIAAVAGEDRAGQARVRGEVRATVRPGEGGGSTLVVTSDVEVLGRLATLGAVPIRRRGDQVFDEFVRALAARLVGIDG